MAQFLESRNQWHGDRLNARGRFADDVLNVPAEAPVPYLAPELTSPPGQGLPPDVPLDSLFENRTTKIFRRDFTPPMPF